MFVSVAIGLPLLAHADTPSDGSIPFSPRSLLELTEGGTISFPGYGDFETVNVSIETAISEVTNGLTERIDTLTTHTIFANLYPLGSSCSSGSGEISAVLVEENSQTLTFSDVTVTLELEDGTLVRLFGKGSILRTGSFRSNDCPGAIARPNASPNPSPSPSASPAGRSGQRGKSPLRLEAFDLPTDSATCAAPAYETIDVMVAFTPSSEVAAGGQSKLYAHVVSLIQQTNAYFEQSDVNLRVRLVHLHRLQNDESGFGTIDLDHLTYEDGVWDEVHTLRDQHGADVVMALVPQYLRSIDDPAQSFCGLAWINAPGTPDDGDTFAFGVISGAFGSTGNGHCGARIFAHELGHILGLNHDYLHATELAAFDDSYGYRFFSGNRLYATIMSYIDDDETDFGRYINFYSNPSIQYAGGATGERGFANATSTLNRIASYAAGHRPKQYSKITGYVLDGGQGLTGARIRLNGADAALTGRDGRFSALTPINAPVTIVPFADGKQFNPPSITLNAPIADDQCELNFTALPEPPVHYLLSGKVLDREERGINGVVITSSDGVQITTSADPVHGNGSFELSVSSGWKGWLHASSSFGTFTPDRITLDTIGADLSDIRFELRPAPTEVTIEGSVTDVTNGSSAPLSRVAITDGFGAPLGQTGDDGNFLIELPVSWQGSLVPVKLGYVFEPGALEVTGLESQMAGANFYAVESTDDIIPEVTDIPVLVTILRPDRALLLRNVQVFVNDTITTESNVGQLRLSLQPEGTYTIRPVSPGYSFEPAEIVLENLTENQAIEFTGLPDGIVISGRVLNNGVPISQAGVTIESPGRTTQTVFTDMLGVFASPGEYDAPYTLTPFKQGFRFIPDSIVVPSATSLSESLVFEGVPLRYTVSGQVQSEGKVTTVLLKDTRTGAIRESVTVGAFSFDDLPHGSTFLVRPTASDLVFSPESYTIEEIDSDHPDILFTAITGFHIRGQVRAGQTGLPGVIIQATRLGIRTEIETDANGRYDLLAPPGSSTTLQILNAPGNVVPSSHTVSDISGDVERDFEIVNDASRIYGTVQTLEGTPVGGVFIDGGELGSATTDESGSYEFKNVALGGHYRLAPSHPSFHFKSNSVEVSVLHAEELVNFTALAGNGLFVAGAIVDSNNQPISGVSVSAVGGERVAQSDSAGLFMLKGFTESEALTLNFSKQGFRFTPASFSVTPALDFQSIRVVGTRVGHTVSGKVLSKAGHGLIGVHVSANQAVGTSGANGSYTVELPNEGVVYIVPRKTGYYFEPYGFAVRDDGNDLQGYDFTAVPVLENTPPFLRFVQQPFVMDQALAEHKEMLALSFTFVTNTDPPQITWQRQLVSNSGEQWESIERANDYVHLINADESIAAQYRYRVLLQSAAHPELSLTSDPVEIDLQSFNHYALAGRVALPKKFRKRALRVMVTKDLSGETETQKAVKQSFSFPSLPAGSYTLSVRPKRVKKFRFQEQSIRLSGEDQTEISIVPTRSKRSKRKKHRAQ